jgi:regulatory LuxR family protein
MRPASSRAPPSEPSGLQFELSAQHGHPSRRQGLRAALQSVRDLARFLFVTEKTVERHLSSAYHKLGIRSRYQLPAAIAPTTKP